MELNPIHPGQLKGTKQHNLNLLRGNHDPVSPDGGKHGASSGYMYPLGAFLGSIRISQTVLGGKSLD
jgi:hypothetical protein